ncbi:MAG: VWA domain-containing protein [Sedimentisphaerales bacterium]|nr:VWA domain-containing protein [Sedimentisphaerales bacterium]
MNELRLANYQALWLLWLVPVLAGLYAWSFYRKRQVLRQFATHEMLRRINVNVSVKRQIAKAALMLTAVLVLIIALTQPGWNPRPEKIQRKGRDIVVILDVSKSMLAEDLYPNRLERAKLEISELLDVLEGDRVGIIAFAGSSVLKCPLTGDYGFIRLALSEIDTNSVSKGGTMIGDAIRMATEDVFDKKERDFKDIILITDGEDHGSFPDKAAEKAAQEGIRIFAIGLGDENEGKRIPITGANGQKTFLKYNGREIWSKLDADALRKIVFATPGGKYINWGTGAFSLQKFYLDVIAASGRKELESTTALRYDEKFQIFIALAIGLLVIEAWISERKKL